MRIRKPIGKGKTSLLDGELELLKFSLVRLEAGEEYLEKLGGNELGIVLLSGKVTIQADGKEYSLGPRKDVFSDPPWGLYLPGDLEWKAKAAEKTELALAYAGGPEQAKIQLVSPKEIAVHERGRDHFQRRVMDIMVSQVEAKHLLIGETFNYPGQWSSYPPHRHDQHHPPEQYRLEEFYLYKLKPEQGFGIQRIYNDARTLDQAWVVENNDLVIFREGYHPVVAAAGYQLYYLWVLAGPVRLMKVIDDPRHAWVHNI